jgi:hypothetical protein
MGYLTPLLLSWGVFFIPSIHVRVFNLRPFDRSLACPKIISTSSYENRDSIIQDAIAGSQAAHRKNRDPGDYGRGYLKELAKMSVLIESMRQQGM